MNTATIAGIMAAKNTSTIIPMCHPLPLTGIDVHFSWDETNAPLYTLNIQTTVSTTGKTGVEMEALTAASATALTIYDMTKAVDKGMIMAKPTLKASLAVNLEIFNANQINKLFCKLMNQMIQFWFNELF